MSSSGLGGWRRRLGVAMLALLLAACGGADSMLAAVGSGGTGGGGTGGGDTGGGGTPSMTFGTIRGFGSVIVNGVRYDDSRAAISNDEGVTLSADRLRLGMTALVRGTVDATATAGVADQIQVLSEVRGSVQAVSASSFTVLGAQVRVAASTVYEGFTGLASIEPGTGVEVYGLYDEGAGAITATRVERAGTPISLFKARGPVGALDTVSRSFSFGSLLVDYSQASLVGLAGGPATGAVVRVSGARPPGASGVWRVDRVELVQAPPIGAGVVASLEGRVTEFQSLARFTVNGVAVDASRASVSGGAVSALGNGVRVEVTGTLQAGVLQATRLEIEDAEDQQPEFELQGAISAVPGPGLFVVRNTTVDASAARIEGGTAADLKVGRNVEVHGRVVGGVARATEIHIEN